jgi:protocatechuate 3,4-dioxygenase beta subunit
VNAWAIPRPVGSTERTLVGILDNFAIIHGRLVMNRNYRAQSRKLTGLVITTIVFATSVGATSPRLAHTTEPPQAPKAAKLKVPAKDRPAAPSEEGAKAAISPAPATSFAVQGSCRDEEGYPLPGAEVVLFKFDRFGASPAQKWEQRTNATGEYRFENLKPLSKAVDDTEHYLVAARKPKHASRAQTIFGRRIDNELDLILASNPGTLSGQVTNEQGMPLAGVEVFLGPGGGPLPGFMHAVTDRQGRYSIADLPSWNADDTVTVNPKTRIRTVVSQCFFYLKHPDYPVTRGGYTGIPQEVDVQLEPGITIEGRVLDTVTGQPAAGAVVSAQGIKERGWGQVIADKAGAYKLVLTADQYNIWAEAKDRTSEALDSFEGPAGKTTKAPDLQLIAGGFIVGKVVDRTTGEPLSELPGGQPLLIAHYGPARPRSGAAVGITTVNKDGIYRLRVAPGDNYPYLMHDLDAERTPRNARKQGPIYVEEGETVTLDFHVGVKAEE